MSATAATSRIGWRARRSTPASCPDTLGADMHGYNTHVPPPPGTPAEHADDEANPFFGQAKFRLRRP